MTQGKVTELETSEWPGKGFITSLLNIYYVEKRRGGQKTTTLNPRSRTLVKHKPGAGLEKTTLEQRKAAGVGRPMTVRGVKVNLGTPGLCSPGPGMTQGVLGAPFSPAQGRISRINPHSHPRPARPPRDTRPRPTAASPGAPR